MLLLHVKGFLVEENDRAAVRALVLDQGVIVVLIFVLVILIVVIQAPPVKSYFKKLSAKKAMVKEAA